ncbi:unnamed protein product [Thelazia callipaeda]|uniref:Uncharacterized protein n=1 Tax=Thelazia callipaeda TaxID=103827 RepID=A0A0N5CS00_THECL|nr:unnamed protein product [Thelazia callipaeda]
MASATSLNTFSSGNNKYQRISRIFDKVVEPDKTVHEDRVCVSDNINDYGSTDDVNRKSNPNAYPGRYVIANPNNAEQKMTLPRTFTPSPSVSGRSSPACHPIPPHSRIANIRRESNNSIENELAHERLMQFAQQVSVKFNEFSIGSTRERKRTHSLSEPISVLTNAFIPHSCSPSPTRSVDLQKQYYSPSTQQVVRNIAYSPSPSPTPSPTRHTLRSISPIAVRQVTKRRYHSSSGCELNPDQCTTGATSAKRAYQQSAVSSRGCVSPLASENVSSISESATKSGELSNAFPLRFSRRLLVDPAISVKLSSESSMETDDDSDSLREQKTNIVSSEVQWRKHIGLSGLINEGDFGGEKLITFLCEVVFHFAYIYSL